MNRPLPPASEIVTLGADFAWKTGIPQAATFQWREVENAEVAFWSDVKIYRYPAGRPEEKEEILGYGSGLSAAEGIDPAFVFLVDFDAFDNERELPECEWCDSESPGGETILLLHIFENSGLEAATAGIWHLRGRNNEKYVRMAKEMLVRSILLNPQPPTFRVPDFIKKAARGLLDRTIG